MYYIGGPATILPKPIESFLGWTLCISCLSVSGYHYYVSNYIKPFILGLKRKFITSSSFSSSATIRYSQNTTRTTNNEAALNSFLKCWIPLTTHSRSEISRKSPLERYDELTQMIYHLLRAAGRKPSELAEMKSESDLNVSLEQIDDEVLVAFVRENRICRRLASLVMRPYEVEDLSQNGRLITTYLVLSHPHLHLLQRLVQLWPRLLELPSPHNLPFVSRPNQLLPCMSAENEQDKFNISLIIPSYNEKTSFIQKQLNILLERCHSPERVEVIIVNAGGHNSNDDDTQDKLQSLSLHSTKSDEDSDKKWCSVKVLSFTEGGGRGPCMNYGADHATGSILTFCHLDTKLPKNWDIKVCDILHYQNAKKTQSNSNQAFHRANSCAFSFGIDTSKEGLSNPFSPNGSGYFPPGIRSVETTANIRTQIYSLPYGDQSISVPRNVFNFLGGYPDQCLMEDYELVALLRRRASQLTTHPERLKIIQGDPALCSPRRWQKFGVLYVTYMNSKFVNLYAGGMTPDDLYRKYYGRSPPSRSNELSPWEVEMKNQLECMSKG